MKPMRSLLLVLFLAACGGDSANGTLMLKPDAHTVVVGASTFVTAYLDDGVTMMPENHPVVADWSVDIPAIISLTPTQNIQKVNALAVGNAVVTAHFDNQTAVTGFTVVASATADQ
jgi:hypothetical protein